MQSIPASDIVTINSDVIGVGGSGLQLNAVVLTESWRVPVGTVQGFPNAPAVASYFGATSPEAEIAGIYFNGFVGSNILPGNILFNQYTGAAVPAYERGGNVSAVPIATLAALGGHLYTLVNGVAKVSSNLSLTGLTSQSAIAAYIQTNYSAFAGTVAYDSVSGAFVFTTTATGGSETLSFIASQNATATACTTTGKVLTVGGTVTGTFAVGDYVAGTDSTNTIPDGTVITKILTGTGGAGTYQISNAASPADMTSAAVTDYSPNGALAVGLALTKATGAVLSQGAGATTPAAAMNAITAQTTNWATFMTAFDPDGGTGNTVKLAFAAWVNTQNSRYAYACWDTDTSPTTSNDATGSLGNILTASNSNGTVPIWGTDFTKAAFFCGAAASIDYTEAQGATDFCFKQGSGLTADATSLTVADNLRANGYNFYGAWATANQQFVGFNPGSITGEWQWADDYVNQIWLTNAFQLALMTMLFSLKSVPYDSVGYAYQATYLQTPIQQGLSFGMYAPGIPLSPSQIAQVNNEAGMNIAQTLSNQGYFLQILPATPTARAARASNPINFWYVQPEGIQKISMNSIALA